jgi:hypothetical protein
VKRTTPRNDNRNGDATNSKVPSEKMSGRGIKMMTPHVSDRLRSKITGNVYEVKKIVNEMIILESLNGTSQVLTELNNIALFYESEQKKDEDQG